MNIQAAREILRNVPDNPNEVQLADHYIAKGVVDTADGPEVRALVDALEYYCNHKGPDGYTPAGHDRELCELNFREDAIQTFHEAVGEKP